MPRFSALVGFAVGVLLLATSLEAASFGGLFKRKSPAEKSRALHEKVQDAIRMMKREDPDVDRFFKESVGYVVFPAVVKAGVGFGGAMGKGEFYQDGNVVGTSVLTQGSFGLQLGAQSYVEIIFFQDNETLEQFQNGSFEFGAQLSAVALTYGASADATFDQGLAIFTVAKGGLMYEASIGGQVFTYQPK